MTTPNRHWYALATFRNLQSVLFLMAHAAKIARAMGSGSILLHLSGEEVKRLEAFGEVLQRTEFEPNPEELRAALMPLENLGRRAADPLHPDMVKLMQRRVNGERLPLHEREELARAIGCDQRDLMPDSVTEMLRELSEGPQSEAERRAEIETPFVPSPNELERTVRDIVKLELLRRAYSVPPENYSGPAMVPTTPDLPDGMSINYGLSGRLRTGKLRKGDEIIGQFTEVATPVEGNNFFWETGTATGYAETIADTVDKILSACAEIESQLATNSLYLFDGYTGSIGVQNGRMVMRVSKDSECIGWIQELAEADARRWGWKSAGDMEGVSSTAPTLNDAVAALKRVWEDDRK